MTVDLDIPEELQSDLLGKALTDLQENIVIGNGKITGNLKYVTGYTGFDASHEELQSGNYLAFHADVPDVEGVTITVKLTDTVTLDEDKTIILRIADKNSQTVTVVASKEGYAPVTKTFSLRGLTVEAAPAG